MIAKESEGSIRFASDIRKIDGSFDLNEPDRDIVNSPSCSNNNVCSRGNRMERADPALNVILSRSTVVW